VIMSMKAMADPTFASIVAMPAATFPVGGTQQNYDYEVGHDGIIGVKTGSDSAAQGCWAFAAQRTVAGTARTVYGVVLGIPADSEGLLEPALTAGVALANAVPATVTSVIAVPAGTVVGYVDAPWRDHIAVKTVTAIQGVAAAGSQVTVHVALVPPAGHTVGAGQDLGTVSSGDLVGASASKVVAATAGAGPTLRWRLTRR